LSTNTQLGNYIRWQDRKITIPSERIQLCERWGYDALFMGEGIGHDAFAVLGYCAALTKRMTLATAIAQIPGRSPTSLACGAQTLAHFVGPDRQVILGLGTSAEQISEGFFGGAFSRPIARLRDHVAAIKLAHAGAPIEHRGETLSIPYDGADARHASAMAMGIDTRDDIPLYLAAASPQTIALAAEIFDGWYPLPGTYTPTTKDLFRPFLEKGFARSETPRSIDDLDIWAHLDAIVAEDVATAMFEAKRYVVAYWIGFKQLLQFIGHLDRVTEIDLLIADGKLERAIERVPDEFVDDGWLLGPPSRIRERVQPWLNCGLSGLIIRSGSLFPNTPQPESVDVYRVIAEAAGRLD
jgi:alkanesulfonate monooxygenase SsuD/methylene tetrahydromethanopterin reductase-like flavin-dependent oxidoreductase (luciferase family)